MLTDINLSGNYLEIDLNVETVLRVRLDGDITTTIGENKIEYVGSGLRITVNTTPLEWKFEIRTDNMIFKVSYVDFPEMPEVLAGLIEEYNNRGDEECDYCHGPVGRCGGSCKDTDLYY
jgi:hypothetical protein